MACGSPSYAQLYRISAMLPPSTTSGVLNARTAPKLAFVLAFVRAALAYAEANDVPVPEVEHDLELWKARWERLYAPDPGPQASTDSRAGGWRDEPGQLRPVVPWQLPAPTRLLVGRENELAWLDERLAEAAADSGPPGLLLYGRAGAGKSALALTWARRRRDQFPDGQLYADFGAGSGVRVLTPAEVLIDFLAALGNSPGELPVDDSGLAAMFRSALADRQLLIVIENAEDARDVQPFLPGDGRCLILVTARDRLPGLLVENGLAALEVPALPPAAAIELLTRSGPELKLEQAQLIAQACDYLPLPVRVAADTLQQGENGEVLSRLIASLTHEPESDGVPALSTILAWSLGATSSAEADALAALSLLPGTSFDVHEAAAVLGLPAGRTPPLLATLTRANLISSSGGGRYELHPLVREWVSRVTAADGRTASDRKESRRRLLGYYLWTADAADRVILPQRGRPPLATSLPRPTAGPRMAAPPVAVAWVAANLASLTAAVVQAELADDEFAFLLPHVLTSYFNLRKPWPQWQQMCQSGIRVARRYGRPVDVGNLSLSLGIALRETHRAAEAAAALRRSYEAYREADMPTGQAMALNNLATVYTQQKQPQQAAEALRQALGLLDDRTEPFRTAIVLHNLADAELRADQLDQALEHVSRASELALTIKDRAGAAMSLATLAEVHDRLGQWQLAAQEYERALVSMAAEGDNFGQINAHRKLGRLLIRHGRQKDGAEHLDHAKQIEDALRAAGQRAPHGPDGA